MGCDQGTVNSNCTSAQSFCIINGQAVKNNSGISRTLSSITQYQTSITDDIWNRIHTVLRNIRNYGERGTRNPSVSNLSDVTDNNKIALELYNKILSDISVAQASGNPTITKVLMDQLQTSINNYQLNSDRCNSCNTACNTSCQASAQSCSQMCFETCWEGCSGQDICTCGRQGGEVVVCGESCGGGMTCSSSGEICSTQGGCCQIEGDNGYCSYGSCAHTDCSTTYYKY